MSKWQACGWTRKLRCQRCHWVWQAQLSDTDKLLVAADAMPPVRRTLAAIAQAAADAARTTLPRLRRATAVLADELEAGRSRADRTPTPPAGSPAEPVGTKPARATVTPPSQRISAGGCPGHRRCQATVLVAIVAAILVLVTVLVTILATIVVAVAAVIVTFAVPYSRTCGDRRGNCCRAYRCCLGHAANRVVLCHARFAGEPSRRAFCPPCRNG